MKKLLSPLLLLLLTATQADAANNALIVTPGVGVTIRCNDVGVGVQSCLSIPGDTSGNPAWGTAGSANANILTVQGIAAMTPLLVTASQSGTWNITNISGTVSLPTGASTAAKQPALGTAGAASADVISVQGIAAMTPLLANPGTAANWGLNTLGSTTSGQSGQLALGAVTTAAPVYTTAQSNALSLDTAGNLRVNVVAGGGAGGTSSNFGSVFPGTGTAVGASDGTNMQALRVTAYGTAPTGLNSLAVNAFVTNTNANGSATSANSSPVVIASDQAAVKVSPQAITTGGSSTTGNIAANNTTAVVVKASAGTLYGVQLSGIGSAPAYLKIYNATAATCGSGTPVKRLIIPAASTAANGAGSNISFGPAGIAFGTGITYCITTGITDADATAPAANTFLVNLDWQ